MKPIPRRYCEAADNAVIPGRPWWRPVNGGYARRDGAFDVWPNVPLWMGADAEAEHRANPRNVFVAPLEWTPGKPTADLRHVLAAVERIDTEHPLPHPGYRAGQVWLVTWGVAWDLHVIEHTRNEHIVTKQTDKAGVIGFLLHDPLMPSKAPWGPT